MPRLSVETTAEVKLKPTLKEKLQTLLERLHTRKAEIKGLQKKDSEDREQIETIFADAGEYEALKGGVRITTPMGDVPLKVIEDTGEDKDGNPKKGKLNEKTLMKKHKLTIKDLDKCRDAYKPRKSYLGIWLPGVDEDDE